MEASRTMTTIITAGNINVARYSCGKLGFRLGSLLRGGIYSCWVMSLFSESKNRQKILFNNMLHGIPSILFHLRWHAAEGTTVKLVRFSSGPNAFLTLALGIMSLFR